MSAVPALDGQVSSAEDPVWWRWTALTCYSGLLALLLARHVFWGDEIHAWQLAVYSDSLHSLFQRLPSEPHPALWFLILRGTSVVWNSPQAMLPVHWLIASLSAYLILWYCPLPRWQRMACCFGYYLLFEYGVICRNYAIGVMLAFCFVAVQSRYKRAIVGPALILALLVHTNIFGAFLAVSLLVWLIAAHWRRAPVSSLAAACLIVVASTVIMLSYIRAGNGVPAGLNNLRLIAGNLRLLPGEASLFLSAAVPIPRPELLHFWNTYWFDSIVSPGLRKATQYAGTMLCLALGCLAFIHRRAIAMLFCSGTLLIGGFAVVSGGLYLRHMGHWFILILLCCWLDRAGDDAGTPDPSDWQQKIRRFYPAALFALQPVAAVIPVVRSFQTPFSGAPGLVQQVLNEPGEPGAWSVVGYATLSEGFDQLSSGFGSPVYSPDGDEYLRFNQPVPNVSPETAIRRIASRVGWDRPKLLLCLDSAEQRDIVARLPPGIRVTRIFKSAEAIVDDEPQVCLLLRKAAPG